MQIGLTAVPQRHELWRLRTTDRTSDAPTELIVIGAMSGDPTPVDYVLELDAILESMPRQ
jgi:hypothetical protein